MLTVDDYGRIRRAHRDGMSIREMARTFHHSRHKIREILHGGQAEPAKYARRGRQSAPKLGQFHDRILEILKLDEAALAFSDWGQIFQGERMTAALLDRLTHHSEIFEMNGESFRFKESMQQKQQPGSKD